MSKRELISQELNAVPDDDLDTLLGFIRTLKLRGSEDRSALLLAESALAKDWLSAEEEAAWADL